MSVRRFEDFVVWQKARLIAAQVYRHFGTIKDFGFRDQIRRAAVSIGNNIAEGCERKSNEDFKRFLFIAKGSCGEVRSMTRVARDLGYLNEEHSAELPDASEELARMLFAFIKKL